MSAKIDAELKRIAELGQTPTVIYVGRDLYGEVETEDDQSFASDLVTDGQKASVQPANELDYHGIRVLLLEHAPSDYLRVET